MRLCFLGPEVGQSEQSHRYSMRSFAVASRFGARNVVARQMPCLPLPTEVFRTVPIWTWQIRLGIEVSHATVLRCGSCLPVRSKV